jgi:hypothetical protein
VNTPATAPELERKLEEAPLSGVLRAPRVEAGEEALEVAAGERSTVSIAVKVTT